ncbi:MAG TPA: uroporphyrinogen decarboxylase family protein [Anaerolineales bacterium]|nr:uroporphyrinogen decarboxylase family protein [Anaerolineales bacterium]
MTQTPSREGAAQKQITPRERAKMAMRHAEPDRVPVDFLATMEIWDRLIEHLKPDTTGIGPAEFFDPAREAILRQFDVDCRVLSYDMFCTPPEWLIHEGAAVDWWVSMNRSTPNRMWRQVNPDDTFHDIWSTHSYRMETAVGAYEGFKTWPLSKAESIEDLKQHPWPEPDWWDFSPLPEIMRQLDTHGEYHIRFRIGSLFEIGWQLRGLEEFMMDLASNPSIPMYIMDRLTEIHLENTRRVLELAGDRLDMVYFYDDVGTQNSLMISKKMWKEFVRPHHVKIIELAHRYGKPVMYHTDGAIYPLIPDFIEMGVDVLNPIQPDAKGMEMQKLKDEFGDKLVFHGGVDIMRTLPRGTREQVVAEVKERVRVLGKNGGYILCSSHHIQPDTPIENVIAMYDPTWRYREV